MTDRPSLSQRQRDIIFSVLQPFAGNIETVGVFGSRAMGNDRPASDVDLVIYGDIPPRSIDRLWTLFDESSLAIRVDVLAYDQIKHAALRHHIDSFMLPLFNGDELRGNHAP